MRETIFRGKTTPKEFGEFNNMWVCGDLIKSCSKYYIHPQANGVTVDGELGRLIVMHEVIPETVGQYTGLLDRDGRKIFEGDIVRCQDIVGKIDWNETHLACTILARNTDGGMQYYFIDDCLSSDITIIGNIHDNPEMAEV